MRKLTEEEEKVLDRYIKFEMDWIVDYINLSPEMRMSIYNSFGFQRYLLRYHWRRLKAEILISVRIILEHLRYK